jgi:hypothetical protein
MPDTVSGHFEEVKALVDRLDELVPNAGAIVVYAIVPDGCYGIPTIKANRLGYLRLGISFVKAAFVDSSDVGNPYRIDPGLSRIRGLEHVCYSFERREKLRLPEIRVTPPRSDLTEYFVTAFVMSFFALSLASLVVGAVTICRWLIGWIWG